MGVLSSLHANIELVLSFIFPAPKQWQEIYKIEGNCCGRCGYPYSVPEGIQMQECANCNEIPWYLDRAFSSLFFKGDPRKSILEFKYQRKFYWRAVLGEALVEGYHRKFSGIHFDAIIPVALHSKKQQERGFNQAEELSLVLGKKVKVPVWNCLSRSRETVSQASQNRRERLRSPQGSFELMRRFDVRGCSLLIVDDVLTTGTTANECARVLREAGARYIAVLTVARGV